MLELSDTEENTFVINSIEDLVFFSYDVKQGNTYEEKTVKLGLSLDFNSSKSYVDPFRTDYNQYGYYGELKTALTSGEGFKSIGSIDNSNQSENSFAGIFDGNGKSIINLYMKKSSNDNSKDLRLGLFGNSYGTIKDLGLINCDISGTLNTSGSNTAIIGGIVGYNYGEVNSCFTSGKLECIGEDKAKTRVAGIAGNINNAYIYNCYNLATIRGGGNFITCVGGILGVGVNGSVENCYNVGELFNVGGTENTYLEIGGIIANSSNVSVNNCYNCNSLNSNGDANDSYIGGIIGLGTRSSIDNSHNKGSLILNANIRHYNQNGLIIGRNIGGTVQNSSYLKFDEYNGSGFNGNDGTDDSIEKENNMSTILEIVGDKFKNGINEYPILNWQ